MDSGLQHRLIEKLKSIDRQNISEINVVLLPDFFVDHFLTLQNFDENISKIQSIYQQGGGNIPNISQRITQGGNSANTALALAKLGFNSHLICSTDSLGLNLLEFFLGKNGVDLLHVKSDGRLAITTALEFGDSHTNVMIGDTGSVSNFAFEDLNQDDLNLISKSDLVCLTTWNLNKNGTNLAKKVFDFAKQNNTKTYFDTGDPSPKKNEIGELFENVLKNKNLDIIGLNENELQYYTGITTNSDNNLIENAKNLKEKISARIDLHTKNFACSIDESCINIPCFDLYKTFRSTGAGDAWNAGNIFGELLGFADDERLLFANSVAAYYISSSEPNHPSINHIIEFLNSIGKN